MFWYGKDAYISKFHLPVSSSFFSFEYAFSFLSSLISKIDESNIDKSIIQYFLIKNLMFKIYFKTSITIILNYRTFFSEIFYKYL